MKDFANALADYIVERESSRLDSIMGEVAKNIQNDMVKVTYGVIDAFYQDYMPEDGRVYIRTDELSNRARDSKGKFKKKSKKTSKKNSKRSGDVSLQSALKALDEGNQPAIGVCKRMEGVLGYQAGVLFDEDKISKRMKHTIKGFDEWDIVEDFLWGVHGNDNIFVTEPSAGWVLYEYINSYKPTFDKHYKAACKKFK